MPAAGVARGQRMANQAHTRSTPSGRHGPLGVTLWGVLLFVLVVAGSALAAPAGPGIPPPAKNVLLLYGESRVLPAVLELDDGIRVRFAEAGVTAQLFTEYLDLSWATEPRYQDHARAFLRDKYGARPLDAVIALGTLGLRFALQHGPELFPGAPIVFAAVTPASGIEIPQGAPVTGVWMRPEAAATVAVARRLQPGARRLVVVGGISPQDRALMEDIRLDLAGQPAGLETTYLEGLPLEDLRRALAALRPDSIVLLGSILRDTGGGTFSARESLRLFGPVSGAPIYGLSETMLGHGIVGGRLISFRRQGAEVADLTLRVLGGEPAASLAPIRGTASTLAFDGRELRRWGLNEARLPPDSVVTNRRPSWTVYRWQIAGGAALIVLQAALIVVLLAHRRRRKRAEAALTERLAFETVVSDLSARLINLRGPDLGVGIVHGLKRVGEHLGVDRASILELSPRDGTISPMYAWTAAGVDMPARLDIEQFPWLVGRMRRGEAYAFARHDDLPAEAATDRAAFERLGIRSGVGTPLRAGGALVGVLTLAVLRREQSWSSDLIARIEFVGGVFAAALSNHRGEVEREALRRDLTHVGRVSSMGELAASIAHELNQPLTAILSNAQVAQQLLGGQPIDLTELREILADIVADDRRAGEVIRRLREFVRKGETRRDRVDVNTVVEDVLGLVRNDAMVRNVAVMTELAPDAPAVRADRIQLQQVVLNLVLNGLDAMRDSAERDLLVATGVDPAGAAYVAVSDRGGGISEEDLRRVFDPFFTTKREGLGMGLAIARSLVESHGGRLIAENNKQGGATFTFTIPAEDADAA